MRSLADVDEVVAAFIRVAELASVAVEPSQMGREFLPAPHRRPQLPAGFQGVYVFMLGDRCLKVGKAGPKARARFTSQHYSPNSAPSTLAKSILTSKDLVVAASPLAVPHEVEALSGETVGAWIEKNTARASLLLPVSFGAAPLALLEAFIQCQLNPLFEGKVA